MATLSTESSGNLLQKITRISKQAFFYVFGFSFFVNLLMLTVPLYMLQLYSRVISSGSMETLLYLTLIAVIALATLGLLELVRSRIMMQINIWADQQLSPEALLRSADDVVQGGQYGTQSLRDISSIRQFLASPGVFTLFDSPWVPIYLFVIFLLHPVLGYVAVIGAILLFSIAVMNEILTRKPLAAANMQALTSQRQIDIAVNNAEVIQAMGMMDNIVKHWSEQHQPIAKMQAEANRRSSLLLSISKFLRLALQILMLGIGAYLVIQNQLTPGAMIVGAILLSRALAPVEQSIGVWKQMLGTRQAYQRLKNHFAKVSYRTTTIKLPTPKGKMSLENVYYRSLGGIENIINGLSLEIAPGEMIALIGPSGAGKTTLARLITGIWKASHGDVRLDDADVYTWERQDFGQHVGYVPQDIELFMGSVKQNIARMGEPEDEAVIQAAKLAGVHELILHLPSGYETEISSQNFQLSAGQRQRIALARAVYKNPKLIVLDEPNSNLDNDGEIALVHALKELKEGGATIIIIAHRPNILKHCDRIAIINEGQLQSIGEKDAILSRLQGIAHTQKKEIKDQGQE